MSIPNCDCWKEEGGWYFLSNDKTRNIISTFQKIKEYAIALDNCESCWSTLNRICEKWDFDNKFCPNCGEPAKTKGD